jgi:hypothetical protein
MRALRRRLASCALALTALQLAVLFSVPVSACCMPKAAAAAHATSAADKDCCPVGSHKPGECPLHKDKDKGKTTAQKSADRQTSRTAVCRMMCDAPHGPQFLLGAIGVLPVPEGIEIAFTSRALDTRAPSLVLSRAAFPDAPPPKLL